MNRDNMFLVKYRTSQNTIGLGLEDGQMMGLVADHTPDIIQRDMLDWLLSSDPDAPPADNLMLALRTSTTEPVDRSSITLQAPVGQQEIWAAGVTYKRSEEAREADSNNSTIYSRVYNAARPELFFKGMGYDAVGTNQPVGIRYDASWSVPEPELVVVLNADLEVIGFTIGNDMSSRDIEGTNPLYLPQAKVYEGSCALGPRLWLQPGRTTWPDVKIEMRIERGGQIVFDGATSTAAIHRPLSELIDYLGRCKRFPCGVMLFTGAGIVPSDTFALAEGDTVRIRIDPIGELVNTVRVVGKTKAVTV
jgi:2-dehydro-3-deoxy-D-arabinonate dehydratase